MTSSPPSSPSLNTRDEQAKETPDEARLAELQAGYQEAGSTYSKFCS
jgi:hypothetical protein